MNAHERRHAVREDLSCIMFAFVSTRVVSKNPNTPIRAPWLAPPLYMTVWEVWETGIFFVSAHVAPSPHPRYGFECETDLKQNFYGLLCLKTVFGIVAYDEIRNSQKSCSLCMGVGGKVSNHLVFQTIMIIPANAAPEKKILIIKNKQVISTKWRHCGENTINNKQYI